MAIPITIPRLGWSMEEGVFAGWLKRDGDAVRAGEPLFSLEGDKATQEIEALDGGILKVPPTAPAAGTTVTVGMVIGFLLEPGEFESPDALPSPACPPKTIERALAPLQAVSASAPVERPRSSPLARRLAREHGIEWVKLSGTGSSGRIRKVDVLAAVQARADAKDAGRGDRPTGSTAAEQEPGSDTRTTGFAAREAARAAGSAGSTAEEAGRDARPTGSAATEAGRDRLARSTADRSVPASRARRAIAARMMESRRTTAPVTLTATADATNLVALRRQFKAAETEPGGSPGVTDFLIKLTALTLKDHPLLNARWREGDDQIVIHGDAHIGFAVDTDAGLVVPVIRGAAALGVRQIAAMSRQLVERALERRLRSEDIEGGTFTITNLGSFGIETFTPIINPPQSAILGVGKIERRPIMDGDKVVGRDQMVLCLTFDHRIVDGAPAARFLQQLVRAIENPAPWLIP
jgi:pyruvate dehydrogenase E2 component (dihydrolipoamide acetyltransferase)